MNDRVGMVRRRRRRPKAIGPRGGLGKAGFVGKGYTLARITRSGGCRSVADLRDATTTSTACASRLVLREIACDSLSMGSPALGGAPGCGGHCAGSSQVAVALSAVVGCDRFTAPVSGASPRGPGVGGFEALHVTLGRRGGVAIDRHEMDRRYARSRIPST
jgi:hypothetical protein